ncbi:hypothetical protein IA57_07045 [Mangrovimonas yunxiaonensis]|uniref:Uncharacterized protein n=1 Tax=Mangrovimonas yunxiaonensis TaxID=1197477 RepID=A0A084TLJ2_9FLAO|nr:hypothetical protein [Mangrovimonas yunxiaonensis]KFB01578.1 hypothetical protein IA57_07045 [Mangrovimonas yunxiaonensis]MBR9756809.1 hypothetical protein [Algicola sp.]GGH35851.1 hypothetical protein GCM10011364_02700 [Mangrovimonas yunxiaonensis]
MKSLTITLIAIIFCVALTGLNSKKDISIDLINQEEVQSHDFTHDLAVSKHIRKTKVPTQG